MWFFRMLVVSEANPSIPKEQEVRSKADKMNHKGTKYTKKSDELSNLIIGSAINVPVLKDGIRRIVN